MPASNQYMAHIHDLMDRDPKFLTTLEQQEVFMAKMHFRKQRCPYCDRLFNVFEAADEDYGLNTTENQYHCPGCDERVLKIVPIINSGTGYFWGKYLTKWPGADDRETMDEWRNRTMVPGAPD